MTDQTPEAHVHVGKWCSACVQEGIARMLRAIIGNDSGGFVPRERGITDKDGKPDDWVSVGWVFDCYAAEKKTAKEANDD